MNKPVISVIAKFEVTQKRALNFDFSTEELRKFPTHEQYLYKLTTEKVILKLKPTSSTDIDGYISLMKEKLKKQFNAESVRFIGKVKV